MGLIIYRDAKGEMRPTWWGRVTCEGKAHETNLKVPIKGIVPLDADGKVALSLKGDDVFERSRKAANAALKAWREDVRKDPAEHQKKAYKARTGASLSGVPFPKLIEKWEGCLIRKRKPTKERTRNARVTFDRFATFARDFAAKNGKRCNTLNDVTPEIAAAWFDSIKGVFAWGTIKDMMHLMSGAFRRWSTNGQPNPFSNIILRDSIEDGEEKKRTERKALTAEQFDRLLDCARDNDRLYPLIVCASFTGMRLGDVCRLKVADVDLEKGFIDCVTAKAGVRVKIPIIDPALREVLTKYCAIPADGKQSPFVFPWAAHQYEKNRTAIVRSVKPYFAKAIYGENPPEEAKVITDETTDTPPDIRTAVADAGWSETKCARVIEVYERFKRGEVSHAIAAEMKIARGQVSGYLKDAERLTGEVLRPRAKNGKAGFGDLLERTRIERKIGKYAASIWGWHNLRHHFITCALNRGVPLYKVQAIVGHTSGTMTAAYADTETETERNAPALPDHTSAVKPTADNAMLQAMAAMFAAMPDDQRKAMAAMLTATTK